jgi:hypothetical protein
VTARRPLGYESADGILGLGAGSSVAGGRRFVGTEGPEDRFAWIDHGRHSPDVTLEKGLAEMRFA